MEIVKKGTVKEKDKYASKCTKCGCVYRYNIEEVKTITTDKNGFSSSLYPWYTECPESRCSNTNMHSPLNKL